MPKGRGRHPARIRTKPPEESIREKYLLEWCRGEVYHHPERFPRITSGAIFGNSHPLDIDIGSATGEFVCACAREFPDKNFLGVEMSLKPNFRAIKEAVVSGLDNVKFLKTDFRQCYPLLEPDSLRAVYVHFPIPVLRPADKKHELFSPEFLENMYRALKSGGIISVVTDAQPYHDITLDIARADSRYNLVTDETTRTSLIPPFRSYYHEYWVRLGRETFGFVLVKEG